MWHVDSQSGHLSFETGEGDMNSGSIRLLTGKSTTTGGGGISMSVGAGMSGIGGAIIMQAGAGGTGGTRHWSPGMDRGKWR